MVPPPPAVETQRTQDAPLVGAGDGEGRRAGMPAVQGDLCGACGGGGRARAIHCFLVLQPSWRLCPGDQWA